MSGKEERDGDLIFLRRLLLAILVLSVAWLFWQLRFVVVLAFGATLFAIVLDSIAQSLRHRLAVPERLSLTSALLLIVAGIAGMLTSFGTEIADQALEIRRALPASLEQGRQMAASLGIATWLERWAAEFRSGSGISANFGSILMSVGDGLTNVIILLVGAVFLASKPQLYRTGFIKLVPKAARPNAATALDDCDRALRLWLKGRLMAMVMVGFLTTVGLWFIGVPSYLALGLLATLLEFVPFFGPIVAAIPAILLALLISPEHALLVVGLFLVLQQVEGNLITPLVQQHAVELPPALLLFALLAFGLLFGLIGVLLAEPLTVAIFVLVKRLYVREALGTRTPLPGEEAS